MIPHAISPLPAAVRVLASREMTRISSNRSRWEPGGHRRGKERKYHSLAARKKVSFCGYRVTSKESQENASKKLLGLNPK